MTVASRLAPCLSAPYQVVEAACEAHTPELVESPTLEQIIHYDQWARRYVADLVAKQRPMVVA